MSHDPIHIEPDAWCEWCGDPLPEIEERHTRRRFCSRRCKEDHRNDISKQRRAAARAGMICAHCGNTFDGNSTQHVFCSESCTQKARYRRKKGLPEGLAPARCAECGVGFIPGNLSQMYCSKACGRIVARRREADRR